MPMGYSAVLFSEARKNQNYLHKLITGGEDESPFPIPHPPTSFTLPWQNNTFHLLQTFLFLSFSTIVSMCVSINFANRTFLRRRLWSTVEWCLGLLGQGGLYPGKGFLVLVIVPGAFPYQPASQCWEVKIPMVFVIVFLALKWPISFLC